ncbi:cell wall hydrolase [Phenylobacterium sp.]|uniref:cell wall hydrolase n=1 Tax=Phenylobacterium sp. TaxID=1871053 RepID=UPI002F4300F4
MRAGKGARILQAIDKRTRAGVWATLALTAAVVALWLIAAAPRHADASVEAPAAGGLLSLANLTDQALNAEAARLDPATRAIARRLDPALRRQDLWDRPVGWGRFDLGQPPDLGFDTKTGEGAVALNNLRPFAGLPIRPMRPFVLEASADDSARALHCMTQAIYYEAAREPVRGQQAVAQVVLNRLRHPAYPKSICGVVYQGSALSTGCQFTFTCDGALRWTPQPALWRQAEQVAKKALAGFVDKDVGSATHYHAAYVVPYWAPTLVKMTQVGQHIFYRWTGPWGEPPAFTGRYEGREGNLSPQLLASLDPLTQGRLGVRPAGQPAAPSERKITLAIAGEVRTYTVADPAQPTTADRPRTPGTLVASRRQPTPDEVKRINDSLAALEKGGDAADKVAAKPD